MGSARAWETLWAAHRQASSLSSPSPRGTLSLQEEEALTAGSLRLGLGVLSLASEPQSHRGPFPTAQLLEMESGRCTSPSQLRPGLDLGKI